MSLLFAVLLAAAAPGGAMQLTSTAFADHQPIPPQFTCEGEDVSPPLAFSEVPAGTKSLVLVVDDPDAPDPRAPKMTWFHWVLYDLPATTRSLAQGASKALPKGAREGTNSWGKTGWGGPCPPIGRHRYFFKLYALDTVLGDLGHPTQPKLEQAMRGHVLAKVELVGTYQKGP